MKHFFNYFLWVGLVWAAFGSTAIFAQSPEEQLGDPVSIEGYAAPFQIMYTGCGGQTAPVINAGYEQRIVELVNVERWNNGNLPPLKRVDALDNASRYHAADLAQDNYFEHDSYDRIGGNLQFVCGVWDRVPSFYGTNWYSMAENIAAGQTTPEEVMNGWMASSGHRANILSTSNWEIGVGYYQGSGTYYRYWAQDFGKYANRYPIVINREAGTTTSRNVQLYIYGAGTWPEMRLKSNNGVWTAWQAFQTNVNWQLDNTAGLQSVTVELRNGGSTVSSVDKIYVDIPMVPELGDLPDDICFLYSRATGELVPSSQRLTPANLTTGDTLAWQLATQGSFFNSSVTSGITPQSFTVTANNVSNYSAGDYNGSITVSVTNINNVTGAPHPVTVHLAVTNAPLEKVFLPLVTR